MKKFLLLLVLCLGGYLVGCGMVDSADQRTTRLNSILDIQGRQIVDDWDYLWLVERNSRMTYWHPRVGY